MEADYGVEPILYTVCMKSEGPSPDSVFPGVSWGKPGSEGLCVEWKKRGDL